MYLIMHLTFDSHSKIARNCIHIIPVFVYMSQPHFGLSVRMRLTLPKVETWSPLGLPKTQSSIAGVKTPLIEVFFISMENS